MLLQKNILLIEDNFDVRENTAEILELANYHVWTAANGKDGVVLAKKHLPDLIICDIMMPELDGYGVLHILSHDQKTAMIPFIFLTAKTEKSDFRKGMNMGADDYITKPFEELDLLNTIRRRLEKSNMLAEQNSILEKASAKMVLHSKKAETALQELKDVQKKLSVGVKYMLFHEDSYPCYLYFLRKGKVKIYKTNEDGKELITELYQEGDYFGYRSLFGNGKYGGSAMTLEESEIVLIHKEPFLKLVNDNPQVSSFFISLLANRVQNQGQRLLHLAYDSVRTRVADTLLFFCKKYESGSIAQERTSMEISREDLANWVGTSKETLIRTLSDFKQEKFIVTKGRFITVIDKKGLGKLVNG